METDDGGQMTPEELRKHNEAILSKLDLKDTLAEYKKTERGARRGNIFIRLLCLLLYLKRKEGREFSRSCIMDEIGEPEWAEDVGCESHLHYRLKYPECHCEQEHWATISLKQDQLHWFGTYNHPTKECTVHADTEADRRS